MDHQILLILLSRRKTPNISQTNIQMRDARAERAEKGSWVTGRVTGRSLIGYGTFLDILIYRFISVKVAGHSIVLISIKMQ